MTSRSSDYDYDADRDEWNQVCIGPSCVAAGEHSLAECVTVEQAEAYHAEGCMATLTSDWSAEELARQLVEHQPAYAVTLLETLGVALRRDAQAQAEHDAKMDEILGSKKSTDALPF